MKFLDAKAGAKIRAVLWIVSAVVTILLQTVNDLDQAGWVLTPAPIVSVIGNWSRIGDLPPGR